jgi:hypothetical protein
VGVDGYWIAINGPDSIDPRVNPAHTGQPGAFVKDTLGFFLFASRSFHLERFLQFSPKFYVLAPALI